MMDPAELAKTQAAFERGYQADRERQAYYQEHAGVPIGWDAPPDTTGLRPRGLGYSAGVDPVAVYEGPRVGLSPVVVPTPEAFDLSAPASVTGSVHSWGQVPGPDVGNPGGGLVYLGTGEPPRRSLLDRLLGRRR